MRYVGCKYFLIVLLMFVSFFGKGQDTTTHLREVKVKDKTGDFRHLYQVEGMKITAGKKSEVINVEKLTVNKSTNNARQIFGKVAGLNIFENDGAGLQLSIGGRGLDPNRTSNFNVRQNGYDISADVLGYPESYYTPPTEALRRIEIIKGASGLQYGTQFGGLLNFEIKQPGGDKPFSLESRQTAGSNGFLGSYNSVYGTSKKLSYIAYVQYKKGNGWRPNSKFQSLNAYVDLHYQLTEKQMLGIEYTHMNYLAQQPGGLDDKMFAEDPHQSNRSRNWFAVNWNLLDIEYENKFNNNTTWQTRINGLIATRDAIGYRPNRISQVDNESNKRDLLKGKFQNITLETRLLHYYSLFNLRNTLASGIRLYKGNGNSKQGNVLNGSGANFEFNNETEILNQYSFPNYNAAGFVEQIIRITDKWNITPGVRFEYIRTKADGYYVNQVVDLRDSIVSSNSHVIQRISPRTFLIGGIGSSYKPNDHTEFYGNLSQNYRSVTYNDMMIVNPSFEVDSNIKDERGWSADLGYRGKMKNVFRFDVSGFFFRYDNKIAEYDAKRGTMVIRKRGNAGIAHVYGLESLLELDVLRLWKGVSEDWNATVYSNFSYTKSKFIKSPVANVVGKRLEYVPTVNWRGGLQASYKSLKASYQISYLSEQFSDATNAKTTNFSAVNGVVPAYYVMDISLAYGWKWLIIEGSVNNLTNKMYFTRRATGYPGPGIIPSDGRMFYMTVGVKL